MSINLDTSKVQSSVLPNLNKAKDNIQNIYDLSTKLKSIMPSSTMFKQYANDLPNKIYNIKGNISNASKKIEEKMESARKIEVKNQSMSKALLLDEKLFNNSSTSSQKKKESTNVKSAVDIETPDSSSTGAKTTNKFTSFFKGLFGGIKDVGTTVGNWFKSLFSNNKNEKIKELAKEKKEESQVVASENIEKTEFNYKDLFDTSFDDKKIFGKDTTLGLNCERIEFDKIYKYDDGSVTYMKDGKVVKRICKDYVEVGNTTYYLDGTYSTKREDKNWDDAVDFYSANGKIVKTIAKVMGEEQTFYYNEAGIVIREVCGSNEIIYDDNGDFIKQIINGKVKKEFKNGKTINYDENGNIETEIEKLEDRTITYNKTDNTKEIKYNNGVVENYDEKNRLKTSEDKNGIKTKYEYLKNGEKFGYIAKNENGETVLTCYDKNGNIKSQSVGKRVGGAPGSDGETIIPIIEGKTNNYSNGVVVSTFESSEGVTVGENYQEYNAFGSKYGHYQGRIEELGLTYHFCQGVNTVRENYDSNGNLKNVTCTGESGTWYIGQEQAGKVSTTQVYYPGGNWSTTEKRYDFNGNLVKETYYLRDKNGNILEHY